MIERESLDAIFSARALTALFQPILTCPSGGLWGHEALIRGPSSGPLHSPLKLFDAAAREGRLVELDLLCREVAIEAFGRAGCPGRLFLNVTPDAVVASDHPTGETLRFLERAGVAPERVVIEITEQFPIHDYAIVRHAVDHYRSMGFAVALDDLGAGYAGLRHWSELRPDYVKIDRHFASGVESDAGKREVVRSVLDMARRMGTRVIVEGIETEAEYTALRALGMTHSQGYLFGRPAERPLTVDQPMPGGDAGGVPGAAVQRPTARLLAREVVPAEPTASVAEVAARFRAEPDLRCVPLVGRDGRAVGIVRRDTLLSRLAHNYGHALFAGREVTGFVESSTVTVPGDLPLEALSRRVTEADDADEAILITDPDGLYLGVGSVFDLLRRITDLQVHSARHANPLTGLPGNVRIEQHIDALLAAGTPFTVVHADLDHFKAYNDFYGYQRGDEAILATARILQARLHAGDFAGHVGGDDFVLLLRGSDWEPRCRALLEDFAAHAPALYDARERERGGIETRDRQGCPQRFPLLSISLAAVPVLDRRFTSHYQIATVLAEIKHCAKREPGNSLFVDRRRQPEGEVPGAVAPLDDAAGSRGA
ncbi:EAL and GGDEF domain-containing protein [Arhodomonas aquaeolei]|uniref:bifunctional diguanylate cyclase/phosphodiesterase n=1 Tax=Arhodomonas TaxID=2368 RepID=UPI0013D37BA0|nr:MULTISPECIES: bifunctional diguanylate cyclase/phosphodiesterase [Arhodomonas]MCS4504810.1 EAL and GGDEF domain-containing protein [Arhodomonas aquaeolei]